MATITFFDSTTFSITSVLEPTATYTLGTGLSAYGSVVVPPGGLPGIVLTQAVGNNEILRIASLTVWGDIDADFIVYRDAVAIGGCRTSPSKTTETILLPIPLPVTGPATIYIKAQHFGTASETLKANLSGTLNTNS